MKIPAIAVFWMFFLLQMGNAYACPLDVFVQWVSMNHCTIEEFSIFVDKGYARPFEPPHQPWHSLALAEGTLVWEKHEGGGRLSRLQHDIATDIVGRIMNLDEVSEVIYDGPIEDIPLCEEL